MAKPTALPADIQRSVDALAKLDAVNTKKVLDYFTSPAKPQPADTSAAKWKFDVAATVSQTLPVRKSVTLKVGKSGIASFNNQDLIESWTWDVLNVFLILPLPKKAKATTNYLLTKLGGQGTYLLFSGADIPPSLINTISKHAKYVTDPSKETDSQTVTAYTGAKEGLLYMLNDFVLFGFRKPLIFIMIAEIESISFTMVTSRTFNVVVQLLDDTSHEFEKIDHQQFQNIQHYIDVHSLSDKSMAEERRAKRQKTGPSELEQAQIEEQENKSDSDDPDDEDVSIESGASGSDASDNDASEAEEDYE